MALAGFCLCAQVLPAANFEAGRVEPVPMVRLGAALQSALPALNLPAAELGTLVLLASRIQEASLPSPLQIAQVPLTGPAAAQAVLASVSELRAKYSDEDLRNLSPGELSGVAEQFIARLQGGSSVPASPVATDFTILNRGEAVSSSLAPSLPTPRPTVYLLSKPLEVTAKLGPVAQVLHYAGETAFQILKAALLLKAGAHMAAAVALFSIEFVKMPPMITAQSMADLQIRYWWKKLKSLKELARIDNVDRITVLTASETHFNWVVAARQENRGLIFLQTSKPLREMSTLGFGEPVKIEDPRAAHLRLTFSLSGKESRIRWTPTLQDAFDKKPIPDEIAASWRAEIREAKKDKSWFKRFFDFALEKNLKVNATLIDAAGNETAFGTLTQGQSTKKLLGITRWDQAADWIKRFWGPPLPRLPRHIPLSDTVVERSPRPFSLKALPGRLWLWLLGRLIVIRP